MTRQWKICAALLSLIAFAIAAQLAPAQKTAPRVTSLRVYLFDCGLIKGEDPTTYGLNKGDVKNADMVVPCYLIVHPKGTPMWDVGVIPDSAFKGDKPVTQTEDTDTISSPKPLLPQLAAFGYRPETSPTLLFRIITSITRRMRMRLRVLHGWSMQRSAMRCSLPVTRINLLTIGSVTARQ